jgi:hypothetical protein
MRLPAGCLALALATVPLRAQSGAPAPTLDALIRAEDARARTAADLAVLRAGLGAGDAALRRVAVRGLGRLERGDVLDDVVAALGDRDPAVREAAAHAAAQAAARGERVDDARRALRARLAAEAEPAVRGALAESVGRLRAGRDAVAPTAEALAALLPARGAVRGLFFLTRQPDVRGLVPPPVGARLQAVATAAGAPDELRATAAAARLAAGGATPADSAALRRDPSGAVRALAATAESIDDPAPVVRYRAVALAACPALATAARDTNVHVAYAAVDALQKCGGDAAAVAAIERSPSPRAVVALAAAAPERARPRAAAAARSAGWVTRVYAARAAAACATRCCSAGSRATPTRTWRARRSTGSRRSPATPTTPSTSPRSAPTRVSS